MKNKTLVRYGQKRIYVNQPKSLSDEMLGGYLEFAELVNGFSSSINHPYMLGDCILCKLNVIDKRQIRKNPYFKSKKDIVTVELVEGRDDRCILMRDGKPLPNKEVKKYLKWSQNFNKY